MLNNKKRLPHALRPLRKKYLSVAKVIENDRYLDMTKSQFIGEVMRESGGLLDLKSIETIYYDIMEDAGLTPLE